MTRPAIRALLGHVVLALGVFVGGTAMTAAWIALYFTGAKEPSPRAAPADPRPVGAPARRLLWLVFDALRTDAAFDSQLMPELARLRRTGTWGVARTGSFTMTGTCVRALGTGVQPRPTDVIHNFRSPPVEADSLFRRIHRSGRKIVLFGDHIWTDLYRMTVRQTYPQPDLGIEDTGRTDRAALADARRHLPEGWDLAVIHLVGSDHAAHKERSVTGLYRQELARYDTLIPELRRLMGPGTTVLVTADHACNRVGNHGAGEREATLAPYALSGPGVKALGRRDIDQRAIAPTLTALLGVPAPWGAEVPGLLEAVDVTPAQRAALAYDHAFQRVAHLRHLLGREPGALRDQLAVADAACAHQAFARCRQQSVAVIRAATRERARMETAPWYVWVAALLLLVAVPWLLLSGAERTGRCFAVELGALLLLAVGGVLVFALPSRYGATAAALIILAVAAGRWFLAGGWGRLGWEQAAVGLLFATVFAVGAVVELAVRWGRGDPTGRWWLAPAALAGIGLVAGFGGRRFHLGAWLRARPESVLWWVAGALFLPLPVLRWWGGRQLLYAGLSLAVLAAVVVLAWRRGRRDVALLVGAGLGTALVLLGQFTTLGAARAAPVDGLAWALALGTPLLYAALGDRTWRASWWPPALTLAAWIAAQVPRLAGFGQPTWILLAVLGVAGVLAVRGRGGRVLHLLLWAALFRLLAGDEALAAVVLFGGALLGLTRGAGRRLRPWSLAALAVAMALSELGLFYLLQREFSFGTIDVTVGFVGGGGLNLVRITTLVVLSYAVPRTFTARMMS